MRSLCLLAAIVLSGCGSETGLRSVEFGPTDVDPIDDLAGPGKNNGPESPWANLEPGEIPDDLFAVAWVDLTGGCLNCTNGLAGPDRYDLVDALGRSVMSFELPFDWEEDQPSRPRLHSLHASGPGRFIATNELYVDGSEELVVWEGDAYAGESRVLARLSADTIELPMAGSTLTLPGVTDWSVEVLPDPRAADRLILVPTLYGLFDPTESPLQEVISFSYMQPSAELELWTMHDLLPPEWRFRIENHLLPAWHVSLAADRSGRLVLGTVGMEAIGHRYDKGTEWLPRIGLVAVDLDDLETGWWSVEIDDMNEDWLVAPPSDGRDWSMLWAPDTCSDQVNVWEQGLIKALPVPDGAECPTPLVLLDMASRSFVYRTRAEDPQTYGQHHLAIQHQGLEVWSLETIGVGLSQRPFYVSGMAHVLP